MRHRGRKNRFDYIQPIGEDRMATPRNSKSIAPDHLSPPMRQWFAIVVAEHDLDPHHLHLLRLACEAFDRGQQAREQLIAEGTTFTDKNGNLRAHPAVAIERDSRIGFARLVRELDLDPPEQDRRFGPRGSVEPGWARRWIDTIAEGKD